MHVHVHPGFLSLAEIATGQELEVWLNNAQKINSYSFCARGYMGLVVTSLGEVKLEFSAETSKRFVDSVDSILFFHCAYVLKMMFIIYFEFLFAKQNCEAVFLLPG